MLAFLASLASWWDLHTQFRQLSPLSRLFPLPRQHYMLASLGYPTGNWMAQVSKSDLSGLTEQRINRFTILQP